jgi:uncharacterized protein YacL
MSTTATPHNISWGFVLGSFLGCILIGLDLLFKRFNLRSFNIAILGLFFGYLMGQALLLIFGTILDISASKLDPHTIEISKISLFLVGIYLGTLMTLRASDELYVSIPFIRLSPTTHKKKDLLLDISALADPRLLDLMQTGLLDRQVIVPRFLLKEVYAQSEGNDENFKIKAKKMLEAVKKLETTPQIDLRFSETDFPDIKDLSHKLIRLARLLDANILSADISRVQSSSIEGIRVINLHSLSNAMKPLTQTGEILKIKIQRYGKEPRQGIGYLEDGTMVVINGGGKHLGDTIDAKVLSVKHTSAGRMIFCNTCDESDLTSEFLEDDEQQK